MPTMEPTGATLHQVVLDAQRYAELGYGVFPAGHDKRPFGGCRWSTEAIDRAEDVVDLWAEYTGPCIGLVPPRGVAVLDLDVKGGLNGLAALNALAPEGEVLDPQTWPGPWQSTPSGGHHVLVRLPDDFYVGNRTGRLPRGVDVRADARGYILVDPSATPAGRYSWIWPLCSPADLPMIPPWIADLLRPEPRPRPTPPTRPRAASGEGCSSAYLESALEGETEAVRCAAEGERNVRLNQAAFNLGQLGHVGLSRNVAEADLVAVAAAAGLGEQEARKTFASGWRAGEAIPREIPASEHNRTGGGVRDRSPDGAGLADAGEGETTERLSRYEDLFNSRRLARESAGRLLYCGSLGGWFSWDNRRWLRSENHPEQAVAGELAAVMLAEADARVSGAETVAMSAGSKAKATPSDTQVIAAKTRADGALATARADLARAKRAQTRRGIESMLSLARSEPALAVTHEAVDADPWILNCKNGVLDLRTGDLRDHNPGERLTMIAGCEYEPRTDAPRWHAFLERVLPDASVRDFVQRLAGYALTGVIRDHILPIFYGVGANGKSVLVGTLQAVLGDYAGTLPPEVVAPVQHGEQHPTGRARLRGLRLAVASESDQTAKLAVATVKTLTGGDRVVARFMRQDFFEFDPTHKLVLVTNHRPRVSDPGDAIWRRVLLVPFEVQIPEPEQDRELPDKLRDELPGILQWAVEGCRAWQVDGLAIPEMIKVATAEYRAAEDTLGEFVAERLEADPEAVTLAKDLHAAHREWSDGTGARVVAVKTFYRMLEERGIRRGPKRNGGATFVGVRVREAQSEANEPNQHGSTTGQHATGDAVDAVTEISHIAPYREKQISLYEADNRDSCHSGTASPPDGSRERGAL